MKYKLYFAIPEQKSVPVNGKITIEFNLDAPQEIILDFREKPEKIKSVSVNGQTSHYDFRNEHIILPKNNIIKGKNDITIQFIAGNQSLNRNDEFLYTLLVPDRARTLFPCFEQPNLKATFTLQLDVPTEWKAVSNTYITKEEIKSTGKTVTFAPTEPLSTYLFSFVSGRIISFPSFSIRFIKLSKWSVIPSTKKAFFFLPLTYTFIPPRFLLQ